MPLLLLSHNRYPFTTPRTNWSKSRLARCNFTQHDDDPVWYAVSQATRERGSFFRQAGVQDRFRDLVAHLVGSPSVTVQR